MIVYSYLGAKEIVKTSRAFLCSLTCINVSFPKSGRLTGYFQCELDLRDSEGLVSEFLL